MVVTTRAAAQRSASPHSVRASSEPSSRQLSPTKTNESHSDGEGRVRPTRKRFAKATINATEDNTATETTAISKDEVLAEDKKTSTNGSRGRGLRRKRSFEEVGEAQENTKEGGNVSKHSRKRSKDTGAGRDDSTSVASISEDSEVAHSGDEEAVAMSSTLKPDEADPIVEEPATPIPPTIEMEAEDHLVDESGAPSRDSKAGSEVPVIEEPKTPSPEPEEHDQSMSDVKKSPPNKRNRDQFTKDHDVAEPTEAGESKEEEAAAEPKDGIAQSLSASKTDDQARDSKRHRDSFIAEIKEEENAGSSTTVPPASGFANTATQSPFAALTPKSPTSQPQTSASAFASSGFASLAGASQSGFGSLGAKSVFSKPKETLPASPPTLFNSAATSGFAALGASSKSVFGATGSSGFGSSHSGFGQLSNGFGSGSSFGGPLHKPTSSFSSGVPSVIGAGSKPAKPFGVLGADDDEEGDEDGDEEEGDTKAVGADEHQKDERFFEQELETGEEDEMTDFKGRGKLYMMGSDKQWKERGTGDFKVNSKSVGDKITARFLMRVDGSHRVVLNSPIQKDLLIEDPSRGPPRGRTAVFLGFVDGKIVTLQLKMRDNVQTLALHHAVQKLQQSM